MKYLIPFSFILLIGFSCKKEDPSKQAEIDEEIILKYIAENNLNATATGSGLYVVINQTGTGLGCTEYSNVTVAYSGYFTDGNLFDASSASGIQFNLQNVIKGWTEGIPYFKEGGNGKLLIPSALGYGAEGNSSIPGNSVLIFDINLIDVQ